MVSSGEGGTKAAVNNVDEQEPIQFCVFLNSPGVLCDPKLFFKQYFMKFFNKTSDSMGNVLRRSIP